MHMTPRQVYAVATAVALLVAITATSAFGSVGGPIFGEGASFGHRPRQISPASAFVLPSTKQCVSGHQLTIELRTLPHVRWVEATIDVNGARFKTIKRSQLTRPVRLTGLPGGRFALSITARTSDGRGVTTTRSYSACATAPKPVPPPGKQQPPVPPVSPILPVAPVRPVTPVTPEEPPMPTATEGSYTGTDPQGIGGGDVDFNVSPSGNLQDVVVETTKLGCAPSREFYNHFEMAEVTVAADGAFSQEGEQNSVIETAYKEFNEAHITYTLSGNVHEGSAAGVYREDITYNNGTQYTCSTSNQSWTATRDEKQGPASFPATEGSYTGTDPQGIGGGSVDFDVSPSGNLQDVVVETTKLGCAPSREFYNHFEMAEVTVAADGAFSQEVKQTSIIETAYKEFNEAHITYTFSGHVHGAGASGEQRIAGVYREDITYNNGTQYTCSTSNQSWTATRDEKQGPASFPATEGSYTGTDPQGIGGGSVDFDVSPSGNLQDVVVETTKLGCAPSREFYNHFEMAEVTVAADGAFSQEVKQTSIIETAYKEFNEAHITYTFSGHVHGAGASGEQRIAGVYREDITYNNGTQYTCSTSNQSWTASHA